MFNRTRRILAATALGAAALAFIPSAAHAEWYFTKSGAQQKAAQYVAGYYANTYAEDLGTACRPQFERYNPRYKYHRWVCNWYDYSDDTYGRVLIIGRSYAGQFTGRVLAGARRA